MAPRDIDRHNGLAAQTQRPRVARQSSVCSTVSATSYTSPTASRPPSISGPSSTTPRVQLVPHARLGSFDAAFSESERYLIDHTNFDARDLSSKDFEFEDVFTFDRPQQKLSKVVEVTTTRERDWSNFSFSHYNSAVSTRRKVNSRRSMIGELYLNNHRGAMGK